MINIIGLYNFRKGKNDNRGDLHMSEYIEFLKTKEENNVWIIVANYKVTDFKKLQNEYKTNKYITWESKNKVNPGDICYFYYTNLPSAEGDTQSRIILRAIVKEGNHKMTRGAIWGPKVKDAEKLTEGFTIACIEPISLKDSIKYNYYSLRDKYNLNFRRPTNMRLTEKNIELYNEIEKNNGLEKNDETSKSGFDALVSYFEIPCYFEKIMHSSNPQTFITKNGLPYYEKHHFIQQHSCKLIDNPCYRYDIVYSDENLITLCVCCHKKIHFGRPEEIEKMLKIIYEDKKKVLDEKMKKYIGEQNVFDWVKKTYKLEE